ncbi:hypothetical protein B0T17DRAFT_509446 [Bombardia bombarda]|uniref:Helix-turn-helix domain-containing protein n=1 Tax=Bombardia bombarda TaxID=252184 RepID=A0AA40BY63_9PEZI|nr:hypothetical protein B0T17DRAFT_509446 [Bombardia bombarda]
MGASGSKVAQKAGRKFPSRAPGTAPPSTTTTTTTTTTARAAPRPPPPAAAADSRPSYPQPSFTKNDAIRRDSINSDRPTPESITPAFADRLRQMGIVQPHPTFSPSSIATTPGPDADRSGGHNQSISAPQFAPSANNATLGVLDARRHLEELAAREFDRMGKSGSEGREFLDIATIRNILVLRQRGDLSPAEIEARFKLKPGVVTRLGPSNVISPAS